MSKYPESDRVEEVRDSSQMLGEFLEWLLNRYTLCEWVDERFYNEDGDLITREQSRKMSPWDYHLEPEGFLPARPDINRLLAEYFDIDFDKYQEELNQMLKELRGRQ